MVAASAPQLPLPVQNVASIAAVGGLAGFLATAKRGAEEAEEALQAQMQVGLPTGAELLPVENAYFHL